MTTKKMLLSIAAAGLTSGLVACDDSTSSSAEEKVTETEVVTEAAFKETCEALGGTLEEIATCAGANSCAGVSWDNSNGKVTEHACEGLNECGGWNCLVPAEEEAA